jgi:hypothetical protein
MKIKEYRNDGNYIEVEAEDPDMAQRLVNEWRERQHPLQPFVPDKAGSTSYFSTNKDRRYDTDSHHTYSPVIQGFTPNPGTV